MTMRRFLAVTHEATITGAPINLYHLLGWLRRNTDVEVHTLILRDGPLREWFAEHGDVTVLDRNVVTKGLGVVQQGLVHLGSSRAWHPVAKARLTPQLRHLRDFDMAYMNSSTSLAVAEFLPPTRSVVSHVHELQVALRTWTPEHNREMFRTVPDRWIAASGAVRDLLVDEIRIPSDKVLLHHEFIDTKKLLSREVSLRELEATRRSEGIDQDAAVVLGTGTLDWRKGPDLFVQLAAELGRRSDRPVELVWVGGDMGGTDWQRVRSDIERTGVDNVHFVGLKKDPMPWFAMADVFALTSREDPFPLVCLENATLGTPIVTYRNGGMPELLEAAGPEAAQGIIEYLDVGAMAKQIMALLSSEDLAKRAGTQLRDRVISTHDVDVAAPKLAEDLMALLD